MNYTVKNNTNKNMSTLHKMVNAYFPYAKKEMGFDVPVTIVFESDQDNAKNPLGKTAYYDPSNYTVVLYTDDRHPKDVMRSLSHELVHHKQNCNGELEGITGEQGYAQTEAGFGVEEEAYSLGNTTFRNWEDSVKKRTNETTYSKRRLLKMNEDMLRNAIRKVIAESPTFKRYLEDTETPQESTEIVPEGETATEDVAEDLDENCDCPDLVGEEDNRIFAPNHYCAHHVKENATGREGKCVDHNWDEALQEVTAYDVDFGDDVVESVPVSELTILEASLEEGHPGHSAKRDLTKKQKEKMDVDDDGDIDEDDLEKLRGEEEQKPVKEWYDNSLYNKLLKEYTRRK